MHLGVIAYGRAGCRIAAALKRRENRSMMDISEFYLLFDTAAAQLDEIDVIDDHFQFLYGREVFNAAGTGARLAQSLKSTRATTRTLKTVPVNTQGVDLGAVDAFLVVGSLGGGTGAAGVTVAGEFLSETFSTTPVYGVGVLPASCEANIYTVNAARSIQSFTAATDTVIVVDNEVLGVAEPAAHPDLDEEIPAEDVFKPANRMIAELIHTVFAADMRDGDALSGAVCRADDITTVLETGGLSTLCFAEMDLPRVARPGITGRVARFVDSLVPRCHTAQGQDESRSWLQSDTVVRDWPHPTDLVDDVTRVESSLLPTITPSDAQRLLVLLTGPRQHLHPVHVTETGDWAGNRFDAALTAVRANPVRRTKTVSVVAVCSGIGIPPRVGEVLDDAEQVLENVTDSSRDAKSVDVFDDDVTGVSPVL